MQNVTDLRMACVRECRASLDCNPATVGVSIIEIELVMAEGKRMQGSAIPVRTP